MLAGRSCETLSQDLHLEHSLLWPTIGGWDGVGIVREVGLQLRHMFLRPKIGGEGEESWTLFGDQLNFFVVVNHISMERNSNAV